MRKKRILVVDDQAIYREPITMTLNANGYHAIGAKDGSSAIKELEKSVTPFNLILLDYSMSEMNGLEFLEKIRKNADWEGIPVIMLTEMADKNLVIKAGALGVDTYILKSTFSLEHLLKEIDNLVEGDIVNISNM